MEISYAACSQQADVELQRGVVVYTGGGEELSSLVFGGSRHLARLNDVAGAYLVVREVTPRTYLLPVPR